MPPAYGSASCTSAMGVALWTRHARSTPAGPTTPTRTSSPVRTTATWRVAETARSGSAARPWAPRGAGGPRAPPPLGAEPGGGAILDGRHPLLRRVLLHHGTGGPQAQLGSGP